MAYLQLSVAPDIQKVKVCFYTENKLFFFNTLLWWVLLKKTPNFNFACNKISHFLKKNTSVFYIIFLYINFTEI